MMKKDADATMQTKGNDRNKLFDDLLDLDDRKFLLKHGKIHNATDGEVLCHQNQVGDNVFVVMQGEVEVTGVTGDESKVLGTLSRGDLFGEISALLSIPRIATVTVKKPSMILEININDFVKLLEQSPSLKEVVYKRLSERSIQTSILTRSANGK